MKIMSRDEYTNQVMKGEIRDAATMKIEGGIVILAEDGRVLYDIYLLQDGVSLEVSAGSIVKVNGQLRDSGITVSPRAANHVIISRPEYK